MRGEETQKRKRTVQEENRRKQEFTSKRELSATGRRGSESYIVNLFTIIEVVYATDQVLLTIELCEQKRMSPHSTGLVKEFRAG